MSKSVKIKVIRCVKTINRKKDHIIISHQADGGEQIPFPIDSTHEIKKDQSWDLNLSLDYQHELLFTIWDKSDDEYIYIGSHDFQAASGSGTITVFNMIRNAEYTISYEY